MKSHFLKTNKVEIDKTARWYNKRASKYEEKWARYLFHTHESFLKFFECEGKDRILDISAGTGLLAKYLLDRGYAFSEMVLNDVSEEMLRIARHRFEGNPSISFSEESSEELRFEDQSFDRVISINSFHHYNNQEKVISEIRRVLKPGGKVYILDWNRKGIFNLVNYGIDLFSDETIQTLNIDEIGKMLEGSSFRIEEQKEWRYSYWNFYVVTARIEKLR